jgi:hypothetical protein
MAIARVQGGLPPAADARQLPTPGQRDNHFKYLRGSYVDASSLESTTTPSGASPISEAYG